MARKKKNDFWDDVDNIDTADGSSGNSHGATAVETEEWSASKSLPLKVLMRFLLMVSCLAALVSGYIALQYVGDRYASGGYSADFYNSGSFSKEYNNSMEDLLKLIQAMEDDPTVIQTENADRLATLVVNYMGQNTNFSFVIQDSDKFTIASSGDDAKDRIEASNHYMVLSSVEGDEPFKSTIPGKLLDKAAWDESLASMKHTYVIYSAVDNDLTQKDSFSEARDLFSKMDEYFNIAKFVGIIAAIIFIICLIFCIISTGMKRGYPEVQLTWFDKIFTEIALAIMIAVGAGLFYGIYRLRGMEGEYYQYGCLGLVLVSYIWIAQSYFSIVRRIKAGRFLRHSIIGTIIGGCAKAIGKLPSPLNVIVGAIILIAINGGVVCGVIFLREYTVTISEREIPLMFIVAPVVFIIEILALFARGGEDETFEVEGETPESSSLLTNTSEENGEDATEKTSDIIPDITPIADDEQMDWETIDLGKAIEEAEQNQPEETETKEVSTSAESEDADTAASQRTEVYSVEDLEEAIRASGLTPHVEEEGWVNFVQLNKDVRKEYKPQLKTRGISVVVRAPEKPVIIDIDRNSLKLIISDIFNQIDRLSADNVKDYVEVYRKDGNVIYVTRMTVAEDKLEEAKAAETDESFDNARKIIEANGGKFVASLKDNELKVGMMIESAE